MTCISAAVFSNTHCFRRRISSFFGEALLVISPSTIAASSFEISKRMIEMIWKSWSKIFEFSSRHRRLFILSIPTKFFRDSPQFTIMDLQSQTEQINFTPMWLAVLTFRRLLMNSFNNLNFCMILLFFWCFIRLSGNCLLISRDFLFKSGGL